MELQDIVLDHLKLLARHYTPENVEIGIANLAHFFFQINLIPFCTKLSETQRESGNSNIIVGAVEVPV